MKIIKTIKDFFSDRALLNIVESITHIRATGQIIQIIKPQRVMFLLPGRYSLVHRDRQGQIVIKRFQVKEPQDMTIKEMFELK